MGSLNKGALQSAIESAFRSLSQGEDGVSSLAAQLANAVDAFVKSGTVNTTSTSGSCNYTPVHPTVNSTGKVS